jgi:hypothetical protein
MPNNAQKEVQTQTQTNGIAPFLIGVDLSSVLIAITDLKEFLMNKFLISTEQIELLTASIDAVKATVDSEAVELNAKLQEVIEALKVPDADISAQIEALESIKSGVDALSNTIVVDVPVVEPPVEPTPDVPAEPPVL